MSTSAGSAVEAGGGVGASRSTPPPRPEILFSLAEPPARILASRLSLRIRACSETLEVGVSAPGDDDGIGGVSAILGMLGM